MRIRFLLLLLWLNSTLVLYAQPPVRFGNRAIYLEQNVRKGLRAHKTSSLELGIPAGERLNVLVQFSSDQISPEQLEHNGVQLGMYLGNNAYYASVPAGSRPSDFVGTNLRAVTPIRPEWKLTSSFLEERYPSWAYDAKRLKMNLSWFETVAWEKVRQELERQGVLHSTHSVLFNTVEIEGTREQILALAAYEGTSFIQFIRPPEKLYNHIGARMNGGLQLRTPIALHGRGLTGKDIRIGIWDANVGDHVDFGTRVQRMEFEIPVSESGGHGLHTSATILGSGLRDEKGRGMAPAAHLWTYNYGTGSNGKLAAREMLEVYEKEHISLTNNSYGYSLAGLCEYEDAFTYTELAYTEVDKLAYWYPELTHVFAAGNDQDEAKCPLDWSHATNYSKNIISVGAVDIDEDITDFSSFGPLRDGRIFPIISARGQAVYSAAYGQDYQEDDGTSFSCPTVTGYLALLSERWRQLHGGALPYNYYLKALLANTAHDVGTLGPDFKYGFGIMDGLAACQALENNWHKFGELLRGGKAQEIKCNVPAGAKELRITLCWNDPVVNREYALGESPIVNDLDLSVKMQGKTYYPYTLDAENPALPAVTTVKNDLDNIEQIRIANPAAGEFTIRIAGLVRGGDKQSYCVVWYFDDQKPELIAPQEGDCLAPETEFYLHTKNMRAPLRVELSLDGGTRYELLGSFNNNALITLPEAEPTDKAFLRVIDVNGKVATTQGAFTIMPQVEDVKLLAMPCNNTGWRLTWNVAKGAAKYKILRADLEKELYNEIAEVDGAVTEYALPDNQIAAGRNMYAVQAVSADGLLGARSMGVVSNQPQKLVLSPDKLPYKETFISWPLQHAAVITGKNLKFEVQEPHPSWGFPLNSQVIAWEGNRDATDWTTPFEQRNNVGAITACAIDLTKFQANTPLELVSYVLLKEKDEEKDLVGSQLRVLVNGTVITDELGREVIEGDGEEMRLAWDITKYAGTEISLTFEVALATSNDGAIIPYYEIVPKTSKLDVGIAWVNDPKIVESAQMHKEDIRFMVQNYSTTTLTNIPVSILVDDKLVFASVVQSLKPLEGRIIKYTHDFTNDAPHKFKVRVRTDVTEDIDPSNNEKSFEVYNLGDVIAMPEITHLEFFGQSIRRVPYISRKISGKQLFVDGRGALDNYKADEESVLQLLPKDEKGLVQVTFKEIDLAVGDTLAVFTGNVPTSLRVFPRYAQKILTGKSTTPQVFLSEAENGGLTFCYVGYNDIPAAGWVAEVQELTVENQWKLEPLVAIDASRENKKKIKATVENLLPVDFYNVGVDVLINDVYRRYTIPRLKASSKTEYVLPYELDISEPSSYEVVVQLVKDGDMSDNLQTLLLENDPLWHKGEIENPKQLYIANLRTIDGNTVEGNASEKVVYQSHSTITFYAESSNAVWVTLSGKPSAKNVPSQLRLWIDANDNAQLEDNELVQAEVTVDNTEYRLVFESTSFANLPVGKHRMRLMLSTTDAYKQFLAGGSIAWGNVLDFFVDVKAGKHRYDYELALEKIVAPISDHSLTATTPVVVKVRNNGLAAQDRISLKLIVDEKEVATEHITCSLAPLGGEAEVTFQQTANLADEGRHLISISLAKADNISTDNTITERVFNMSPKTDKLYALSFVGDKKEAIELPLKGHKVQKEATIEGLWLLNKPQISELVNEDGIWVLSVAGIKEFPDNTLLFMGGKSGIYASKNPVLKPGKWQHIAISMKVGRGWESEFATFPTVFVDGATVDMERYNGSGVFSFTNLWLNVGLDGQMAMFRLWNKELSSAEVQANMTKSVRTATNTLPDGCEAEYIFTEGKGIASGYGKERCAVIQSLRTDVWQPLDRIIAGVEVEGEVMASKYVAKNELKVIMPQDFSTFDKVKLNFLFDWYQTTVTHNNTQVYPNTELNFAQNPEHKLTFKAEKTDFFGKTLTQEFTVQLVNDASDECDIKKITLPKDATKNTWLVSQPESITPCPSHIVFNVKKEGNISAEEFQRALQKVTIQINEVSLGTKVFYGEREVVGDIECDFTRPVVFRTLAPNGRDEQFYTLNLALEQSIQWSTEKITKPFANSPFVLGATSSSGLVISYASSNPEVITVDATGKAIIRGVGKATLRAMQTGDATYKAAEPVEREVEITRAKMTIKMKPAKMAEGDPLPVFVFEYDGLQYPGTERMFAHEYEVLMAPNKPWDASMPPLAQNKYVVRPKNYTGEYSKDSYEITCTEGELTVEAPQKAQKVTFVVVDENNIPIPSITVECGKYQLMTDAKGKVQIYLMPDTYSVRVAKPEYVTIKETLTVARQAIEQRLILRKQVYTLTYKADAHGMIQGNTTQRVAAHGEGEYVIALAMTPSYRFKQWSDNVKEASRIDRNVTGNIDVEAEFEKATYTLKYKIGTGGELEQGELEQTVDHGGNGTKVVVSPQEGWVFFGWSDGLKDAERTDEHVVNNLEVEAIFVKPHLLTWTEDFELGQPQLKYWDFDLQNEGAGWKLASSKNVEGAKEKGTMLMIEPVGKEPSLDECYAATPWLSLEGRPAAGKVQVAFDLYHKIATGTKATFEYSFDGEDWTEIVQLKSSKGQRVTYEVTDGDLNGENTIRFRWSFSCERVDTYLVVDNIEITFAPKPTTYVILRYVAGEHGNLVQEGTTEKVSTLELKTPQNTMGPRVKAVPDDGYSFVQWSDGIENAERQDKDALVVKAQFKRNLKTQYTLVYKAGANGIVTGALYQRIETGELGTPVYAQGNLGYKFLRWSDGSTDNPRTDRCTENATFEAEFTFDGSVPVYSVTLEQEGEGELRIDGYEQSALAKLLRGTKLTVIAEPKAGGEWKLESLTVEDEDILESKTFVLYSNVVVKAVFSKIAPVEETHFADVIVAPNPFDNELRVQTDFELLYTLQNIQGCVLQMGTVSQGDPAINTSTLPAGIYLLILEKDGMRKVLKVVKDTL